MGGSEEIEMVLSGLPSAFVVLPRLSKWFFPASLVPPWCLASCPMSPFLPPWCLSSCPIPFLLPWCLSGCPNGPFLPPWRLPVKGPERHFKDQPVLRAANRGAHPRICREPCLPGASLSKAILCPGCPACCSMMRTDLRKVGLLSASA